MSTVPLHLKAGSECPPLKENQLRLYGMRFCPYVHRAKLVLAAKNIPYEEININLVEKPEWYLKKNAPGQVPSIEWIDQTTKETRFIPESLIVSDYLDETFGETRLQPADSYAKARQRVLVERFSSIGGCFYRILREDTEKAIIDLNKYLAVYEQTLEDEFFGGSKPAMVDYMIWPWFERFPRLANRGFVFNGDGSFPKLQAWVEKMLADAAVQKAKITETALQKYIDAYSTGKPIYDVE